VTDQLHHTARQLLAARTEQEVRRTAVRTLAHIAEGDRCELLQPVGGELTSRASIAFGPTGTDTAGPLETHREVLERSFERGTGGVVGDLSAVDGDVEEGERYRSLVCVPVGDKGLLVAADSEPGAFDQEQVEAMQELADLVAAALDGFAWSHSDERSRLEAVATVISHDVQNLIGVANGRLELVMEGNLDQLEAVERAHERLLDLTDDLVTVLRTGDSVHSIEPVELEAEARRAWNTVDAPEASLSVTEPATIMADASSLCQLFENLFRNAIDHAGPDVTVTVGPRTDGTGFSVADDGPGIPPEDRESVFEMGFSTGRDRTGYGLSIVDRIADAHGWTVSVGESEAGGARFDLTGVELA